MDKRLRRGAPRARLGSVDVVVRRDALADAGLSRSTVRARLRSGRWQLVTPTVIARHNGPLTPDQQRRAAVLTAGPKAMLATWTALEVHGLRGWARPEIHVLIARGTSVPSFGSLSVTVHCSRRLAERASLRRGLPVAPIARSAVDAAAWSATDRAACGVLAAVVQQRLARPTDLRAAATACLRLRRRRLLLAVVDDIEGGAQALSELDFLRFCERHRFPRPVMQEVRRDEHGRARYLDACFLSASGRPVRVEVDGSVHLAAETYWADMRRDNDLVLSEEPVLRFPSFAIRIDDPEAVDQLRRALVS